MMMRTTFLRVAAEVAEEAGDVAEEVVDAAEEEAAVGDVIGMMTAARATTPSLCVSLTFSD